MKHETKIKLEGYGYTFIFWGVVVIVLAVLFMIGCVFRSIGVSALDYGVDAIVNYQNNYYQENNKYKHEPWYQVAEYEYTEHEYVTAKNEKGYQVIIRDKENNYMSYGFGVEADTRTWSWRKYEDN